MWKVLVAVVCLAGAVCPQGVGGEVFTAVASLRSLVNTQHVLLDTIDEYVQREESRLKEIRRLVQVKRDEPKQAVAKLAAIRHPLSAYYLVRDWSFLSDVIFDTSALGIIQTKMSKLPTTIPNAADRQGALQSLLRLQLTYNLSIHELSEGSVRGHQAAKPLSGRDMYDLGVAALRRNLNSTAVSWLKKAEEAASHEVPKSEFYYQMGRAYNRTADFDKAKEYLELAYSMDGKNFTLKTAAEAMASIAARNDSGEGDECRDESSVYRKGYELICSQGVAQKRSFLWSNVWCAYHTNIVPYAAYKMEVLSADPWIVMYYDVITNVEVESVKKFAAPQLNRATVGYPNNVRGSLSRISKTAWLFEKKNLPLVRKISLRVQHITGLETTMRQRFTSAEPLQVANYGIGGQFEPHFDAYQNKKAVDELKGYLAGTGDRIATFMFYLSDVAEGGATVFPSLDLYLAPVKNAAAFWYNFHRNGTMDMRVGHAGCPVLVGEKWIANKWMRERTQLFRHKCGPLSTSTEVESRAAMLR